MVKVEGIKDFDLTQIFECGQCFRWNREDDGSYTGVAFGKIVNMRMEGVPGTLLAAEGKATDAPSQESCQASNQQIGLPLSQPSCLSADRAADSSPEGRGASSTLIIDNCSEEEFERIWRPYLDLDRDYGRVKRALKGEEIARAIEVGSGIRILRQDFWEALVSFIISQNNNIPRIKGCIEKLAAGFGKKAGSYRGKDYYALPEPEVMACLTAEDLGAVRLGYRAPYLVETARRVCELGGAAAAREYVLGGDAGLPLSQPSCLSADRAADRSPLGEPRNKEECRIISSESKKIERHSTYPLASPKGEVPSGARRRGNSTEIIARLRTFQGVGPKVAACTALFGLGQLDAFPIDVWVRRVMHQVYGCDERDAAGMQAFARENFGEYGGIAQQYLFYYIRETSGK